MKLPLKKVWSGWVAMTKKTLLIKFTTACYLAKNERPFNDFPNLMELQEKNKVRDIGKVYLTDKKCSEFTQLIANVIREELEWLEYF